MTKLIAKLTNFFSAMTQLWVQTQNFRRITRFLEFLGNRLIVGWLSHLTNLCCWIGMAIDSDHSSISGFKSLTHLRWNLRQRFVRCLLMFKLHNIHRQASFTLSDFLNVWVRRAITALRNVCRVVKTICLHPFLVAKVTLNHILTHRFSLT